MASANGKEITEVSTVTNKLFNALKDKQTVKVAGIVKNIEDKQTPFAVAKRFKGAFALKTGNEIIKAKYLFLPNALRDLILSGATKLGKWEAFEFCIAITKTVTKKGEEEIHDFTLATILAPRAQKEPEISLVELEAK